MRTGEASARRRPSCPSSEAPGHAEPGRATMLGADLRRPRRRLSSGPGLGWVQPEPADPAPPVPPRPTTLPLLLPPRIYVTKAHR